MGITSTYLAIGARSVYGPNVTLTSIFMHIFEISWKINATHRRSLITSLSRVNQEVSNSVVQ